MEKEFLAVILGDKAVTFPQVKPLDPPVKFASILDLAGTDVTKLRGSDVQAALGHLSLRLYGEYVLLSAFLTGGEGVSKVHCFS